MASTVQRCVRLSRHLRPSLLRITTDTTLPNRSNLATLQYLASVHQASLSSLEIISSPSLTPVSIVAQPSLHLSTCPTHYGIFSQAEKKESSTSASESGSSDTDSASNPSPPATLEETLTLLHKSEELIEKLELDNKKMTEEKEEFKDKYKRSLAETENVRNRMQKQIGDAKIFGIQGFCKDLLEVADILERAVEATPKDNLEMNQELKDLFDGLTMTESQLLKVFGRHGLVRLDPKAGEKFDPNLHEALFQLPVAEKENNTVAVVTQKGFALNGRTLRAAKVGVVKNA